MQPPLIAEVTTIATAATAAAAAGGGGGGGADLEAAAPHGAPEVHRGVPESRAVTFGRRAALVLQCHRSPVLHWIALWGFGAIGDGGGGGRRGAAFLDVLLLVVVGVGECC